MIDPRILASKIKTQQDVANLSDEEYQALSQHVNAQPPEPARGLLPRPGASMSGLNPLGRMAMGALAGMQGRDPMTALKQDVVEPDWYTKQQVEQENAREMEKYKQSIKPPTQQKLIKVGESIVSINPETQESEVLYEPKNSEDPRVIKQRNKDTNDLLATVRGNQAKLGQMDEALKSADRIPAGLGGKLKLGWIKNMDPNNPIMSDWQKVKMVLTDAQLMNTAKTKGAISDKEMELFSAAAANDDMGVVARIKPIIERMKALLKADEMGKRESYMRNYGIPPEDVLNEGRYDTNSNSMEFNTEEEANSANLAPGTKITINGRPAVVE